MNRFRFATGLGDAGLEPTVAALAKLPAFRAPPVKLVVDDVEPPAGPAWTDAMLRARKEASASWTTEWAGYNRACSITVTPPHGWVTAAMPEAFATLEEGIALIEALPFSVCSLGSLWLDEWIEAGVETDSFGDGHLDHGWACAFRGAGHDRLVSRRWLEHGPWRLVKRPDDLSVVVFHDLELDAETAYARSRRGHVLLGAGPDSGYLSRDHEYSDDVKGLYDAGRETLEIVVSPGERVTPERMKDACAIRAAHRAKPPKRDRIRQVAFVFLTEEDARVQLEALWLRELECWVADDRSKRRLDDTFAPSSNQRA